MKKLTSLTLLLALVAFALVLSACGNTAEPTTCPEATPCPEVPESVEPEAVGPEIPFLAEWMTSGHADATAEAFRHWDEDDPVAVPADCAKCHSTYGYRDFIGADGTAAGTIEAENFPVDTTVECTACHSEAAMALDSVVMPSGATLTGLGSEARCMQCHQGRESGVSVATAVEGLEPDTVNADLGFKNIHYFAAAATKYGTLAMGGFQYEGKTYDGNFGHVPEFDACQECHNPHTLEVKVAECANCHEGVATVEDLKNVRMLSSGVDYDGDGDIEEGISFEIAGLQEQLLAAIQTYAAANGGAISYDAGAYPYFFNEAGERYAAWTPRLLKAAYNYQMSMKDPGAFAHGGKYIIQLLVDSIEDLGTDVSTLGRIDFGHFAGSEEAFRHWDEDGEVEADCARCHSAEGLPFFHENGVNVAAEISNGFLCETCHNTAEWPARLAFSSVTFPSGMTISTEEPADQFLCMQCHQGRESGLSVDKAIGTLGDDELLERRFINVHYFAAGATRYGADAHGGYEYAGKTYVGYFPHVAGAVEACAACHDAHELEVKVDACQGCHGTDVLEDIRMSDVDYDGDGDATEGLAGEVATMKEALFAAIEQYATDSEVVADIVYSDGYPYFVNTDGSGYTTWTPALLRAAYNYQYVTKDPGGFAHNGKYILQLLFDSIEALGGDVTGMTRP